MGNFVWKSDGSGAESPQRSPKTGCKRPLEGTDEYNELMTTPKKQKLRTTAAYIYQTLFKEGEGSDVTIVALGKLWRLHRVYLKQSPYFASMFTGNWKESNDRVVHMQITDDNITKEALEITLGSLYRDELNITGEQVVGVLAASVLLQLDPLIQHCVAIMRDTICSGSLLNYYCVANRYGVVEVEGLCVRWLERCLLSDMAACSSTLRTLPAELLERTISSPHLFTIQTEFSVYVLLKMWLFTQLQPDFEGNHDEMLSESHKYFKNRPSRRCFLDTSQGLQYRPLFWHIRLSYIVNHYLDMEMIANDRILPSDWLQPAICRHWYNMLRIAQLKDSGPSELSEEVFEKECLRCGRLITSDAEHIWRWTGYNFGVDVVVIFNGTIIALKRNMPIGDVSCMSPQRKLMYRITVTSLNNHRQEEFRKTTGVQSLTLQKNQQVRVLDLSHDEFKFPLLLSANFLMFTPSEVSPLVANHLLSAHSSNAPPPPVAALRALLRRTAREKSKIVNSVALEPIADVPGDPAVARDFRELAGPSGVRDVSFLRLRRFAASRPHQLRLANDVVENVDVGASLRQLQGASHEPGISAGDDAGLVDAPSQRSWKDLLYRLFRRDTRLMDIPASFLATIRNAIDHQEDDNSDEDFGLDVDLEEEFEGNDSDEGSVANDEDDQHSDHDIDAEDNSDSSSNDGSEPEHEEDDEEIQVDEFGNLIVDLDEDPLENEAHNNIEPFEDVPEHIQDQLRNDAEIHQAEEL